MGNVKGREGSCITLWDQCQYTTGWTGNIKYVVKIIQNVPKNTPAISIEVL
jgi:hypothetical protein